MQSIDVHVLLGKLVGAVQSLSTQDERHTEEITKMTAQNQMLTQQITKLNEKLRAQDAGQTQPSAALPAQPQLPTPTSDGVESAMAAVLSRMDQLQP